MIASHESLTQILKEVSITFIQPHTDYNLMHNTGKNQPAATYRKEKNWHGTNFMGRDRTSKVSTGGLSRFIILDFLCNV